MSRRRRSWPSDSDTDSEPYIIPSNLTRSISPGHPFPLVAPEAVPYESDSPSSSSGNESVSSSSVSSSSVSSSSLSVSSSGTSSSAPAPTPRKIIRAKQSLLTALECCFDIAQSTTGDAKSQRWAILGRSTTELAMMGDMSILLGQGRLVCGAALLVSLVETYLVPLAKSRAYIKGQRARREARAIDGYAKRYASFRVTELGKPDMQESATSLPLPILSRMTNFALVHPPTARLNLAALDVPDATVFLEKIDFVSLFKTFGLSPSEITHLDLSHNHLHRKSCSPLALPACFPFSLYCAHCRSPKVDRPPVPAPPSSRHLVQSLSQIPARVVPIPPPPPRYRLEGHPSSPRGTCSPIGLHGIIAPPPASRASPAILFGKHRPRYPPLLCRTGRTGSRTPSSREACRELYL
ncbi:hypothetical protein P7C73_g5299, partial [Tremellales sp. Uapishka_1]